MLRLAPFTAVAIALAATPAGAQTPEQVAEAALEAAPIWDGHNDVPWQLRGRFDNEIADFDFSDTSDTATDDRGAMHTDLPRLREGKIGAQFWSVYVPAALSEPQAVLATLEQIDVTKRLVARFPNELALAVTADDVERARSAGKIASLMGMEGGHSIGSSLAALRQMYALGARYMTLTHSQNTPWADSATDTPEHNGLTDLGRKVIREMNRIGMLVDLSHVSEQVMHDVLDEAKAPVIFSHSNARAINGHARNVPDTALKRLPENGGIVMVTAVPGFLSEAQRQWYAARVAQEARLETLWQGQPSAVEAGMAEWDRDNPTPEATVSDMADHVDHIRKVAGIDHIGIGGDYDGIASGPVGMEDTAGLPKLFVELARRGYSQADLEKISWHNMMRVMRTADRVARQQNSAAPIENGANQFDN